MFYLAGISISFFLCLLLFSKKNKSVADNILAIWLFIIGVHLLHFYLGITDSIYKYSLLIGFQIPMPLLHGPFLYLYASALTNKFPGLNKRNILHFIPALLSYIYMIRFFLLPSEQKIFIFKNKGVGYESFQMVNTSAIIISGIVYVILTTLLLRKHKRAILNQFSYTEKINLDWIQYLIYGIALIWVFVILENDTLVFSTAVLFVLFIGYFGIRQVGIFTHNVNQQMGNIKNQSSNLPENLSDNIIEVQYSGDNQKNIFDQNQNVSSLIVEDIFDSTSSNKKKYSKSGLSDEAAEQLHEKLNHIINSEKVFKESELTLTELAKRLGTHPNYLSQVINEKEGKNFYDYINTLRTEEFKRIVITPDSKKFTLLALALECGFNSKSSFNKYFRKMMGQSPSKYLEQLNTVEI